MEYPIDAAACTSGAQTDVDMNGFDNTYNWKCGALDCSATVLPHCEGQRGTSADAVTWDYTDIFLLPGNTSIGYNIGAKFRASCT